MRAEVRIFTGTSGYSYAAWKGAFYPPRLPAAKMLAHYATRLAAVEINATFHRMPSTSTLSAWRTQVPPGFRFALKGPQRITHVQRLAGVADAVGFFLRTAAELGDALGPILWQIPPSLGKDLSLLADFLALLPRGARHAFEFRHPSWFDDPVLSALRSSGTALCVAETEDWAAPLLPTARFGYLRLRRPDYSEADLGRWLDRIRAQPWDEAWAFFKHEDEARGPAFAIRLSALAGGQGAEYPAAR